MGKFHMTLTAAFRACTLLLCAALIAGVAFGDPVVQFRFTFIFGVPQVVFSQDVVVAMAPDHASRTYKGVVIPTPGSSPGFIDTGDKGVYRADCLDYMVVGLYRGLFMPSGQEYALVQALLDKVAAVTGHPEISQAPVILYGWSAGALYSGLNSSLLSRRVVAYFGGSGRFYTQIPDAINVPGFQINGETDNNGSTSLLSCQQSLRAVRAISAANNQVGMGVAWQQGHINPVWGNHQTVEFTYYMVSEVLKARRALAGGDSVSSNGFVEYPQLPMESGWLGQIQDFVTSATAGNAPHGRDIKRVNIAPYASYAGDYTNASWMVNEKVAQIYRVMMSYYGQYAQENATLGNSPAYIIDLPKEHFLQQGDWVSFLVDLRGFGAGAGISNVTCYLNLDEQAVLTAPNVGGQFYHFAFPAPEKGVHAILIRATDNSSDIAECFRTLFIHAPKSQAPGQAAGFRPRNGDITARRQTFLSWVSGKAATSHNVYFGTNASALALLANAITTTVVEFGAPLAPGTYFWRVDERNAAGTTAGAVQRFDIVDGAFDGFESGDFNGGVGWITPWQTNASGVTIDNTDAASGGYSVKMYKWGSGIDTERALDLATVPDPARISFSYKASHWDTTLVHKAQCRIYDGTWHTVFEMPFVLQTSARWLSADIDLTPFNLQRAGSNIKVRFEIPQPKGTLAVDNVLVSNGVPEPAALLVLALAAGALWRRLQCHHIQEKGHEENTVR